VSHTPVDYPEAREALVDAGRRLAARGLVTGTSGNLSVRVGDFVVATPSGAALDALDITRLSVIDLTGEHRSGDVATSEVPLHLAIYRNTDARAIVHAHAVASTAVSCVCDEMPALHYNVLQLGGAPRTARYAAFGSEQLGTNVVEVLSTGRTAALMQNHGSIAVGGDLAQACDRLELLEWLCELHMAAHRLGTPRVLSENELAEAEQAFAAYRRRLRPGR
jgi:L-fuculose-phosphate aldolase